MINENVNVKGKMWVKESAERTKEKERKIKYKMSIWRK